MQLETIAAMLRDIKKFFWKSWLNAKKKIFLVLLKYDVILSTLIISIMCKLKDVIYKMESYMDKKIGITSEVPYIYLFGIEVGISFSMAVSWQCGGFD